MKREADLMVEHAERSAVASRAQLLTTLNLIRRRVDPRVLAAETAEGLVGRANYLLEEVETGIKSRPYLSFIGAAAFVAAVGLRVWLGHDKGTDDAT